MLVLLPPSETKHPGGEGPGLDLSKLGFESLNPARITVLGSLNNLLDQDDEVAAAGLKLGKSQLHELDVNRAIATAATMPAIERYTGVLFDALDLDTLSNDSKRWIAKNIVLQNALFGLLRAEDLIPNYRLAPNAKLPGVTSLNRIWSQVLTVELGNHKSDLVIDLRSNVYVKMGPVPSNKPVLSIRPVAQQSDGTIKALNHFNKAAKGRLLRIMAINDLSAGSPETFVEALRAFGYQTLVRGPGMIDLVEPKTSDMTPLLKECR